jgi:hypothetical protein
MTGKNYSQLLYKMSHFNWVLQFYGYLNDWQDLCTKLSSRTRQLWIENEYIFKELIRDVRRVLEIDGRFDQKIIAFLLEDSRYLEYHIKLSPQKANSIQSIIRFVKAIKEPSRLKFEPITLQIENEPDFQLAKSLYSCFAARKIDESLIQFVPNWIWNIQDGSPTNKNWVWKFKNNALFNVKFKQVGCEVPNNKNFSSHFDEYDEFNWYTRCSSESINEEKRIVSKSKLSSFSQNKFTLREQLETKQATLNGGLKGKEEMSFSENLDVAIRGIPYFLEPKNAQFGRENSNNIVKRNTVIYYSENGKLQSIKCAELHVSINISLSISKDFIVIPADCVLCLTGITRSYEDWDKKVADFHQENLAKLDNKLAFFIANDNISEIKLQESYVNYLCSLNVENADYLHINMSSLIPEVLLAKIIQILKKYFELRDTKWGKQNERNLHVDYHFDLQHLNNTNIELIKSFLNLPIPSLCISINDRGSSHERLRLKSTIVEEIRKNRSISNFKYQGENSPWIRNLDRTTPNEDDEKLMDLYLNNILGYCEDINSWITYKSDSNLKHRFKIVHFYH